MERSFRFIDLFAGLGGFHVALASLGGECVFAAERDEELRELYEHNYGLKPWGDLDELTDPATQVPDHDVLAAGFPCQPFSKAGDQRGFKHSGQGQLFFKVLEILDAKRPKRLILENVPNILRHDGGRTREAIESELTKRGYAVQVGQFSPHQFGIPQQRFRAFFVGSLNGLDDFAWPETHEHETDIRDILDPPGKLKGAA